ncbi:MAG: RHS repeat-associated core domain-containing protein, partial [Acidobacteriota bacterium]
ATDVAGQQVEERIAVSVEGQMKIGHFTLSFIDLAVPLSGLDIEVIRTYDSRLRHEPGDFGHGWTLDIRQGSYQNNRPPGDGWRIPETQGPWGLPCSVVQETKSHLTVVRLSDQEVYRFRLTLKDPGTIIGGCIARAEFEWVDGPLPGTTLEILGNDEVLYRNDSGDVIDPDTFELFVPDDVKLTTRDGRIFHLDLQDGVTHLEDLHGNTLDITLDGITHSSGRGVEFVRDGEGRITKIVDPLGKENIYSYTPGAGGGDLTSTTDRVGATTTFTYRDHYLEDIHNALGIRAVRTEYDDSGRMVRMVDAAGKEVSFEHDLDARREVVTNRLGFTRILEYDERGNVTRETDELDAVTVRTYDGKDRLRSETDPLNRTTHFTYDAKSDLREIRDPLDHVTKFTYHELGSPETIEDPLGHVTTNVYDSVGNLRSTTDAENHTTTFEYTPKGELREITDPLNHVTRFIYDAFGNLRRETDALGHATRYTYDDNGVRLTETRTRTLPDGTTEDLVTRFTPDDLGRVTAVEAPDGSVTRTEYDLLGRMRSSTDALGRTTRHTHDAVGNLVRTQYPDDLDEVRTYDAESRLETMTDRGGRTTTYGYDKVGRLRETIYPIVDGVAAKVTNTYDVAGQLEAITDARNHTTNYLYDDAGRRTDVIDPFGHTTKLGYDSAGRRTTVRDERLHTTTFGYDKVGRLLTTTFPDATIHRQSYDGLGRRVTETDANQRTTTFGYDALGRLTSVTDALDQVTSYTYDEVGSFLSQTDANDHTTRFEYDRLGRQIARILPDGARESMAYFADGTLQSHTDFNGATRRYRYDSLGRLKDRIYPGGETVSFTYTPTGQRETATDARGVTSYQYDARDRLREKVAPTGHRLVYGYDLAGNRNFLEATVGAETFTTRYTHDALNRLETVEDPQGGVYTHRYDQAGNRESLSYPNGVATRYEHDSQNRLTLIETTNAAGDVLQSYVYTLGNSGHRDRIDEHDGTVRAYKYDDLYRLEQEKVTQAGALVYQTDWIYDPVGNRESQTWTDADGTQTVTGYAYDVRDRLQSETRGGEVTSYGWDANGNMTRRGDVTYSWDVDNRLVSAQLVDGSSLSTVYDVDGEQVGETWSPAVGGQESTAFLVDTNRGLSQRLASVQGGLVTALHTFGGDSVLATSGSGSSPSYVHRDALDSTRLLTDGAGVVEEQLEYSAYGETKEGAGAPVVHRFTGQVFDDRIDLAYHRARWMAPTLGVFAGMDPWLGRAPDPVTLHRYGYGSMDPVNHVDPTGLFSVARGLTAVAVALTVAVSFTALDAFVINRFQKSRSLTVGEKDLARSVFGDAIDLEKVEIRHNRFVWFQNFNLRWFRRARYMAPDGNIYVHPDWPSELASDLAKSDGPTFIHEMVHVWQHQQGRIVWLERGLEHEYSYQLIEGASFSDYGIEQQAMIVEDYYSIRRFDSPEALLMRGGLRLSKEDVPWFEEIIPFVE